MKRFLPAQKMFSFLALTVFCIVLFLSITPSSSQTSRVDKNVGKSTIIRIDTVKNDGDILPSSSHSNQQNIFTPEQDTAYYRAIRANVSTSLRIWNDLQFSKYIWYEYSKNIKKSDVAIAMESLNSLPKEFFTPDPQEVVQREINIANAFYVPHLNTYNQNGMKLSFADIGNFLGITEDVSPEITYKLDTPAQVEVVVYSISAIVIANIFEGKQPAGTYKFTWNGRNNTGTKMPSGDYIAEIRVANEKYIRKRILIN